MTANPIVPASVPPYRVGLDQPRSGVLRRFLSPWHVGLAALGVGAATVYLWALAGGARSEYYAAIALSMSKSWSNLLFGAMDPTGTVSLDKIPGSYWVPALFVRVFGFSTWSVDAPNAIATAVAVVLVAVTAKRIGGPTAGIVAGLVTATTPILAAVARTNQPESFFVLALALVRLGRDEGGAARIPALAGDRRCLRGGGVPHVHAGGVVGVACPGCGVLVHPADLVAADP